MLAALLSALALLGGESDERLCHGQVRDGVKRQSQLGYAISFRREFGFRSDREFVRRVQRTGRMDEDMGIAFTPREWAYWRMRGKIEFSGRGVDRYLERHPDLSGGTSIEDDWPRGPYLLVRLTRDQALHEAALKRIYRYPDNLRTVTVEHSERALRAVQDAIDFDAAAADGFHVSGTGVDIDLNRVVVDLITARTDHAEYFAARYGAVVVTRVIATELTRLACTRTRGYRVSPTGRSLRLFYFSGGGAEFERVELTERRGRVEVGIVEEVPNGFRTSDRRSETSVVRLARPLAGRRVVDAATGKAIRRLRCRPDSRCFRLLDR